MGCGASKTDAVTPLKPETKSNRTTNEGDSKGLENGKTTTTSNPPASLPEKTKEEPKGVTDDRKSKESVPSTLKTTQNNSTPTANDERKSMEPPKPTSNSLSSKNNLVNPLDLGSGDVVLRPLSHRAPLGEINSARSLPSVRSPVGSARGSQVEKLPSIGRPAPVAFEVDFGGPDTSATTKKNPIQLRLEREARERELAKSQEEAGQRPSTASQMEKKLDEAAERRQRHQEEVIKKASHSKREKAKLARVAEDKKAEQLKKIMADRRRVAEQNRLIKEKELKKKADEEAKHAEMVAEKAKKFRLENPDAYHAKENEQLATKENAVADDNTPITPTNSTGKVDNTSDSGDAENNKTQGNHLQREELTEPY